MRYALLALVFCGCSDFLSARPDMTWTYRPGYPCVMEQDLKDDRGNTWTARAYYSECPDTTGTGWTGRIRRP